MKNIFKKTTIYSRLTSIGLSVLQINLNGKHFKVLDVIYYIDAVWKLVKSIIVKKSRKVI